MTPPSPTSHCAQRLKILADHHRLAILTLLMDRPQHVWELNQELGLEQSLLSHHLRVLRQHGFVSTQRDGKAVLYSLAAGIQAESGQGLNLGCCVLSFAADGKEPLQDD